MNNFHHSAASFNGAEPVKNRAFPRYISVDTTKVGQEKTQRFKALDALRGLAALGVTYLHLSFSVPPLCTKPLHLCVDFFLVLSGFVLAHTYTFPNRHLSPLRFIGHRFARLWPLMAYTAIATFLVRAFVIHALNYTPYVEGLQLLSEVFLVNGLGLPMPVANYSDTNNPPSWTASVEFWLNIPFAYFITKDTPALVLVFVGLTIQILLYVQAGSLATTGGYFGILRCSSSFVLGVASYILRVMLFKAYDFEGFSIACATFVELVLSALTVCIFAESRVYSSPHDFAAPWLFGLVVMCFSQENGLISKALSHLEILGTLSYSIYLNHRMLLAWLWPSGPNPMIAGLSLTQPRALALLWLILLPYSYLTYYLVELPSMRFIRGKVNELTIGSFGFDGQWLHRGEIIGTEFIALNGSIGNLVKTGPKSVVLAYDGEMHDGELWDDGHLHWADGDVWIRCKPDSIVVVSL